MAVDITYTTAPLAADVYFYFIVNSTGIVEVMAYAGGGAATGFTANIPSSLAAGSYEIYGTNFDSVDPNLTAVYPGPTSVIGTPYSGWVQVMENLGGVPDGDGNACGDNTTTSVSFTVGALPTVTFTALADLQIDAGIQAGLGGGTPAQGTDCLLYTSPSPRDKRQSRMPSSA